MGNGWKRIGIIFLTLLILENLLLVGYGIFLWKWIDEDIKKKNICILDICIDPQYDGYFYVDGICECYTNREVVKTEYIE